MDNKEKKPINTFKIAMYDIYTKYFMGAKHVEAI